ncbi:MAG: hypothetical protein KAS05_01685 [Candidatus Omnitrophica bacterium]|nr:hypothetical protein [Candidatus Omnitrophota bacterium]
MELREIIEKCESLKIYEERFIADDYYEVVFYTKDTKQWNELFADILGLPAKPYGVVPSEEDVVLTQKHGGLRENQTLFKKAIGSTLMIAMFWPWQDDVRTTIKVVSIAQ